MAVDPSADALATLVAMACGGALVSYLGHRIRYRDDVWLVAGTAPRR